MLNTNSGSDNRGLKRDTLDKIRASFFKKYGIILALAALFILSAIIEPRFIRGSNLLNVLRQVAVNGIIAIGMTFVIISGCIDLSVGSIAVMNGMIVLLLPEKLGLSPILAVIIILLIGVVVGAISGYSIYKGMPPFIMTLAMQTSLKGVAFIVNNGSPASSVSEAYNWIGQGDIFGIPAQVILYLLLTALAFFILRKTTFGRSVYAVGGNTEAARLSGINIRRMRILIYIISAVMASIAAVVLTARLGACDPTLGTEYQSDAIASTVIGGTAMSGGSGSVLKTMVGVLIIGILSNILNLVGVSTYMQQILKGVIIFAAVASDTWRKRR